jgi:allophanate hydrolase
MELASDLAYKFECPNAVQASRQADVPVPAADPAWITRPREPVRGAATGPLAGLACGIKDNIDVAGLPTTAACPAFAYTPGKHAAVVQKLLDAGASVLGKTNLDQFACGLNGTRSPYGVPANAFDARYVPGGSSSGSAVVVARGEADFALGTDTAGSGRVPAGLNNIVGLKPSRGLVSARGVVPAAQAIDCVSIFARTVPLAVRVLAQAAGHDPLDPYSRPLELATQPLPARFRFGVPEPLSFFGDGLSARAFGKAVARLGDLGGERVTVDYAPLQKVADLLYGSALVADRYAALRPFFDGHPDQVIEPVRSILATASSHGAAEYVDALVRLRTLAQAAERMWDRIDVLLVPTAPTHYTIEQMLADPVTLNRNLGAFTNFVNLLDYAALAVPSSIRADGLPFGVTFVGRCGSDLQLADLGQRYHQATGLAQGATGVPLPAAEPIEGLAKPAHVQVAVVGAHLSGMPLNGQLTERGGTLLRTARTNDDYRLFALAGTTPPKPGLLRVAAGTGAPIVLEVWDLPLEHFGSFVADIPAPLGIGTVSLDDGSSVQGFLCEALAVQGADDITHHGGWRAYMAARSRESIPA